MSSDRFKFRVWDNINKRYDKGLDLIDKDGDLCYQDGGKYCNGEHSEDFTIEQCTGVKDKNDKLIYEGDIIHFYVEFDDGMVIDQDIVVEWDECNCGFDFWQSPDCVSKDGEIIGNIHEMEQVKCKN